MTKQSPHSHDVACGKLLWQEATEKLRAEDPQLHGQLEEMLATQKLPSSSADISDQIVQSIATSQNRLLNRNRNENERAKTRKAMDSILKAVTVFKGMGSSAAVLDPLHVGVAWAGVNLILQLVLSGTEQNAAALQGLAQMSPIITRYAKVEEIYVERRRKYQDTRLKKDFREQVVNLYASILVYQAAILSHSKRHRIVQYARAVPKLDDWNQLLQDILAADAECTKFTRIFDFEEQINQHHELKDILQEQDQQMENVTRQLDLVHLQSHALINRADQRENMEILDWVSAMPAQNDHTRTLEHGKLNSDYAGAGEWLFCRSEFKSWSKADNDSMSILWLRGPVGTGKSSLVCLTIERFMKHSSSLREEDGLVAFFYCSKKQGTEEGNSPKTVLRSLLRQLAWSTSDLSIAPTVKERYRQWQQSWGNGGRELLADDCIELLTRLIITSDRHTIIIVDALDECSNPYELLSNLEDIKSACHGKVKFLLSSRMNVPVQGTFPECTRIEVGLDSKKDIDFFITTEMKRNKWRLAQGKALDLEDSMIETLSNRAQGMFRWVELQLSTFFSSKSNIKRRDAFKRKLDKLDKEAGLPVLGDVYDEIYDMNTPEPEDRSVAERALKWVMECQQPLSIEMLVKAASRNSHGNIDEEVDADYILDICSNFIIVDHMQRVQFAHLSVREYLTNDTGRHGYTTTDANIEIARGSIMYLIAHGTVQDGKDVDARDELLYYAALYWPVHCSWASVDNGEGRSPLQDILNEFLTPGEPSSGFITCVGLWPDAVQKYNRLSSEVDESLSTTKSPVFAACVWGFSEVVKAALSTGGFEPEERNSSGNTALVVATRFHSIEAVKLLLAAGADANAIGIDDGHSPLHWCPSLEVVELLVYHGADVTKAIKGPINHGSTPLDLATGQQKEDIIQFLLTKGADINARRADGSTALHTIAVRGNINIAQLLLEHGADADIENNNGETALQTAAANGSEEVVKLLLKHQGLSDENSPIAERLLRQTKYCNAIREGRESTVRQLLEKGVDTSVKNSRGEYPIHWAVDHGHQGVVSILLQNGAEIDAKDESSQTALLLACYKRNEEMIQFLLDNGADINATQGSDGNVLSFATAEGELRLVDILLKRGADPRTVDLISLRRGFTAFPQNFEDALKMVRSHIS